MGTLYLCPTPIGNLSDMTERVLEVLRSVDVIACEDTRTSLGLLSHYEIKKPLISYHKFNEQERSPELIRRLQGTADQPGENIALISDAGMPAISDPGQILVRKCHEAGIPVTALPGPCAFVTALALSGLDSRRFSFEGFLPTDKKDREEVLVMMLQDVRNHADASLRGDRFPDHGLQIIPSLLNHLLHRLPVILPDNGIAGDPDIAVPQNLKEFKEGVVITAFMKTVNRVLQ